MGAAPTDGRDCASRVSEFDLIGRYFTRKPVHARLGIGDDAALIDAPAGMSLAVSVDTLNEGIHFLPDVDARKLGHKSLAVNLSDLAAMGATPRYALLALTLPAADPGWLAEFAAGFFALAERHGIELIGGDTTRGPLAITITAIGEVPPNALRRDAATPGDDIWVSGELGGAALGLACLQGRASLGADERAAMVARLEMPQPRLELGLALRGVAGAAIDLSDGLSGDLGHVLERSGVCARIEYALVPRPAAFRSLANRELEERMVLSGGDDYELLFTAAPVRRSEIEAIEQRLGLRLGRIGAIERCEDGAGRLSILDPDGKPLADLRSHEHFAAP